MLLKRKLLSDEDRARIRAQVPEFVIPGTRPYPRVGEWVVNREGNTYLVDASYMPERHWEAFTRYLFTYESRPIWLYRNLHTARRLFRVRQVTTLAWIRWEGADDATIERISWFIQEAFCILYPALRRCDVAVYANPPAPPMTNELREQTDLQLKVIGSQILPALKNSGDGLAARHFVLNKKVRWLALAIFAAGLLTHLLAKLIA